MALLLARGDVFSILHRQDDARAIVQTVAVLFGEIIDALARRDFPFGQPRLTDRLTEFRRTRLCRFQRDRNDALENFKGIVGMSGELAAAIRAILGLIGGVEREAGLLGRRAVGLAF